MEEEWRGTESKWLEVQFEASAVCGDLGSNVIFWCWSTVIYLFIKSKVNAAVYQDVLEHFMLPSADKLYEDADFLYQQDSASAHTAKSNNTWFNDYRITNQQPGLP